MITLLPRNFLILNESIHWKREKNLNVALYLNFIFVPGVVLGLTWNDNIAKTRRVQSLKLPMTKHISEKSWLWFVIAMPPLPND